MEPPGLFRGRGEHPRTGMAKSRCFSESVSLNLSQDSVPPRCLLPGHAWENIRHDPDVTWLCKWEENILGSTKYVMLAASSSFKGKSDTDKYQKAIRLKHCIADVRKDYTTKIKSKVRTFRSSLSYHRDVLFWYYMLSFLINRYLCQLQLSFYILRYSILIYLITYFFIFIL